MLSRRSTLFALSGLLLAGTAGTSAVAQQSPAKETRVFELRTYTAPHGKLDALLARFRQHTVKLFEKHGMTNIGYWVPVDNKENQLIYVMAYPSREAAAKSWAAFRSDPEWITAKKESEAAGSLTTKVESVYLNVTDYSPVVKTGKQGERLFELRTYIPAEGRMEALNSRFRDHTVKLFDKHGMTNVGYWTPVEQQPLPTTTLIYILAHKNAEGAKSSWSAFAADPAWTAARKASEEKAGGSLTAPGGVKSVYLKPVDFSPLQ